MLADLNRLNCLQGGTTIALCLPWMVRLLALCGLLLLVAVASGCDASDDGKSIGFSIYSAPFDSGLITLGGERMPGQDEKGMHPLIIEYLP